MRRHVSTSLLALVLLASNSRGYAGAFDFSYGGRLTEADGKPVEGPVNVEVSFFSSESGGAPLGNGIQSYTNVPLVQGVFRITIAFSGADFHSIFPDHSSPVWIEFKDVTHNKIYPRQRFTTVPLAAVVPVDDKTVSYNGNGQLQAGPASLPASGQFLTKDGSGNFIWAYPPSAGTSLQGQTVNAGTPSAGHVLQYDGTEWKNAPLANGTVTEVTASAPFIVTNGTTTPDISMAAATSVSSGFLTSADWLTFNNKQDALGFTPLNKAGDTMSGSLNMGGSKITGVATPTAATDAANKSYADSAVAPYVRRDGSSPLTATWSVGSQDIIGVNTLKAASINTAAQAAIKIDPWGTTTGRTGELRFTELFVVEGHYVGFKAPDNVVSNVIWTLPPADGGVGYVLRTNGAGVLEWANPAAAAGAVSSVAGRNGIVTLDSDDVAEAGNKYHTDARARASAVQDSITDAIADIAASQNAIFDALALELDKTGGTMTGALNMNGNNIDNAGTMNAGSLSTSGAAGVILNPYGALAGETGEFRLKELSIAEGNYVGFKAPDSIAADQIWTLPAADGTLNQVLKTNGAGELSWVDPSALVVEDAIVDGVTNIAPSQNAVFDALALKLDKTGGTLSGPISMSSQKITDLASPTVGTDAANKSYADSVVGPYLLKDGSTPLTGNWNVGGFNISGVGEFSAGASSVSSLSTSAAAGVTVGAFGTDPGETGEIRLQELAASGSNYIGFKAPDAITSNRIWTLPDGDGTANQVLKTDGAGTLAWVSPSALSVFDAINDGVTDRAPSENAVYDALALKLSLGGGTMTGPIDMGTQKITNLATPTDPNDAATKAYADGIVGPYLRKDGTTPLTANWAVGGFNITGVGTFVAGASTVSSLTTTAQDAVVVNPYGVNPGNTSELRFKEISVAEGNYVGFKAPDSIAGNQIWVLPAADGNANEVLKTDGSGNLSWSSASALSVSNAITDGVTATAPSENTVFDALALKLDKTGGTLSGPLDLSTNKISNLAAPTDGADAANKTYVDGLTAPYVRLDGSTPLTGNWAVGNRNISGVATLDAATAQFESVSTDGQAAAVFSPFGAVSGNTGEARFKELSANGVNYVGFKAPDLIAADFIWTLPAADGTAGQVLRTDGSGLLTWVDPSSAVVVDAINDGETSTAPSENAVFDALALKLSTSGGTMSGAIDMGTTNKITNLAAPVDPSDAATKAYADGVVAPYLKRDGSTSLTAAWAVGGFNITGVGSFSAAATTVASLTTSAQAGISIAPYNTAAGQTSELRFRELTGSEYVGFKAPDAIATSRIWVLPAADGNADEVLKTDGAGNLSWTSAASLAVADAINDGETTKAPTQNAVFDALALKLSTGGGTLTGPLSMNTANKITNLATPTDPADAANKSYVDGALSPYILKNGTTPLTGNWALGGFSVAGVNSLSSSSISSGSVTTSAQAAFIADPFGTSPGNTGEVRFKELVAGGANYVGFKAPDAIASNRIWVLPNADGTSDQVLKTDGSGNLSWITPSTLSVVQTITDGQTATAPSQDAVFDALALKLSLAGGTMTGPINMGAQAITNLATPVNPADGATKAYVDGIVDPYLKKDGSVALTGAWNAGSQNITNVGSFSAGTSNVSSLTTSAQDAVTIAPYNTAPGNTSELRFKELSVVENNYVGFKAPDSIAANRVWVLPAADGTVNQVLKTDGSGNLGWMAASSTAVVQTITNGQTTTAPSQDKVYDDLLLKLNKAGDTMTGPLAMSTQKITGLGTPTDPADAVTKAYADSLITGYLKQDGSTPLTSAWAVGNQNITGIANLGAGTTTLGALTVSGASTTTSVTTTGAAGLTIKPHSAAAGGTGELRLRELAPGTDYIALKAPDALAGNLSFTLPASDGTNNHVLKTNGAGVLGWMSASTGVISQTITNGVTNMCSSEDVIYDMFFTKVAKTGATMTGALTLPANGLVVGTTQLVTSGGNVGIGTATPEVPLHFPSVLGEKISLYGSSGANYGFGIQSGEFQIHTATSAQDIALGFGSSASMTRNFLVRGNGDVGIGLGASNPESRLHVRKTGTSASEENVLLLDSNNGGNNSGPVMDFKNNGGGYLGAIAAIDENTSDGRLEFRTSGDGAVTAGPLTNTSTRMTIKSTGDVGIGTIAPQARLHVQRTTTDGQDSAALVLDSNNQGSNSGSTIQFKTNNTTGAGYVAAIAGVDDGGLDGRLEFRVSNDGVATTTPLNSSNTRMILNQSGQLGLGVSPNAPLTFPATFGNKINLHGGAGNIYGIGVQSGTFQFMVDHSGANFVFGYGNSGSLTEVARITGGGRMGIGTNNPDSKLHIKGGGIKVEAAGSANGIAIGTCPFGACGWDYESIQLGATNNLRIMFGATERFSLNSNGTALKGGTLAWENISDIRTKNVHSPYRLGLKEILQLSPIVYSYKKDNPYGYNSEAEFVGFSAQEVQKVIPRAVKTGEKGFLSLSADPIIWAMFNAIKDENGERKESSRNIEMKLSAKSQEINSLKSKLSEKDERLEKMESELDKLLNALCEGDTSAACQP